MEFWRGRTVIQLSLVFSFISSFPDRVITCTDEPALAAIHSLHSEFGQLLHFNGIFGKKTIAKAITNESYSYLLALSCDLFEVFPDIIIFVLDFHLVHHIAEDVSRTGDPHFQKASLFWALQLNISKLCQKEVHERGQHAKRGFSSTEYFNCWRSM